MALRSSDLGMLLGRAHEVELLTSLLDGIDSGGGALVLRGEPGIGKSRLLAEAAELARRRDFTVLSATGVQSETHLAFAGLHQLLRPVRSHVETLPGVERSALNAAFGLEESGAPERFLIAMSVLELLSDVATDAPLLVIAEDAQWLDSPTTEVLGFVARRLQSDPIVLIGAVREGYSPVLIDAGLPEHRLGGLSPAAAAELLDTSAAELTPAVRARLLEHAAGNPLALLELPLTAGGVELLTSLSLPLTERVERAFASRVSELPEDTRMLVEVAAVSDGGGLGEILAAGSIVAERKLSLDAFDPAVGAALIDLDVDELRFRHPLMRSAVRQNTGLPQRLRIHQALADVLGEDVDRRAWHRAALISGEHEEIATELEEAAVRARRRGALAVSVSALRRAAELSGESKRVGRLLAAAEQAFELGQRETVTQMLSEVAGLNPNPLQRARAAWVQEVAYTQPLADSERAAALLAAAAAADNAGDRDLQLDLLWLLGSRAWLADPSPATREALKDAAAQLGDPRSAEPRVLAIQAYADPFGNAPAVLDRVRAAAAELSRDPDAARFLGPAAVVVGAFDAALTLLGSAVEGLRTEGRLGHLPRLLVLQGSMAARIADWDVAIPAAAECRRLAIELGETHWVAAAETLDAIIAGTRGDHESVARASAEAERVAVPAGANTTAAFAQTGRILAAMATGNYLDAYEIADRLFDPMGSSHHPVIACWSIADLAEAAAHIDRSDKARVRVEHVEALTGGVTGTCISLGLLHARAVLAKNDVEAAEYFEVALAADFSRWPLQRARLLLAYGRWLRRRRRISESRAPLRDARNAFDAVGCTPWADQARRELRASGEASPRRSPLARDQLTAQELQIAQLAAQGLSNRQIGQRLYLSHRTVGTHLYRVFPKLGIATRAELRNALASSKNI
jgi:DNA-binding CsgD family transcriptional regulator